MAQEHYLERIDRLVLSIHGPITLFGITGKGGC